jgi:WD40 repeat protein
VRDANLNGVGDLAISDDGSSLACEVENGVGVWSKVGGSPFSTVGTLEIEEIKWIGPQRLKLAFSRDLLAIASFSGGTVMLYDLKSRSVVSTLQTYRPTVLVFSPDGARLAAGNYHGTVHLWDVAVIKVPSPTSKKTLESRHRFGVLTGLFSTCFWALRWRS